MNQTYIHSSRPGENHETSPCVGKAAFWVAEADNLGREGESLNAAQSSALYAQMFLSRRRDLGKYAKNYGERVIFNSFILTLVSLIKT